MAYCQDFDYDVFISYSHLNNARLGTADQGWVTDLHDVLSKSLAAKLTTVPAIWRDEQGLEGRTITDGIRRALENSAVFLAVVSRGFLNSTYCCPVELAGFKHPRFPLVVRDRSRIVVAACDTAQDAPRSGWPPELRDVPCVPFADEGGLRVRTARVDPEQPYWQHVDKLARHIAEALSEIRKGMGGADVSQLTTPDAAPQKPAAAWQKRWLKPRVHITYLSADRPRADLLANQLSDRCDVSLLPGDATDDRRQRRYLENSDGQILLFDCANRPWAEDQALQSMDVAAAQGRPRRLALATDAVCLGDFAIKSDFVVPLGPGDQTQAFVSSLAPTP